MVQYIIKIAEDLQETQDTEEARWLLQALEEELNRLDPRDFVPAVRYSFVKTRIEIRQTNAFVQGGSLHAPSRRFQRLGEEVIHCLHQYAGEGSFAESRSFDFVTDEELRSIIVRDYKELALILLPGGGWKSCVVMAGSILEAILHDVLTSDPVTRAKAEASTAAPRSKSGKVRNIDKGEWRLHDLIEVSAEINVLPRARVSAIDQILRDYRNFVHPNKEIRAGYPCTEAEALMAKGALDSVCNHLEASLTK